MTASSGMLRRVAVARRFGGTFRLHHQGLFAVIQLLLAANVPRSLTLSTLMMEEIRSSETSVIIEATRRHILATGV
jgi:hypothetical protein